MCYQGIEDIITSVVMSHLHNCVVTIYNINNCTAAEKIKNLLLACNATSSSIFMVTSNMRCESKFICISVILVIVITVCID